MLQQHAGTWKDAPSASAARGSAQGALFMLAYRSRAVLPQSQSDLDRIIRSAEQRNVAEGLTGLLIYDQGCFFQWLEGPRSGLTRVWESIQRDPRHCDIEILRDQAMPERFFPTWDMRLARRTRGKIDAAMTAVEVPRDLLRKLRVQPALSPGAWDQLFADVVVPRIKAAHPIARPNGKADLSRPLAGGIWHAHREAGDELAATLLQVGSVATAYIDAMIGQGAGLDALCAEVFEPAARCLGDLWDDDKRAEIEVTLGLGRLQAEVRRLSAHFARDIHTARPGHAVLVAPQPGEPHSLGAAMSSELFSRDGWDVSYEFLSGDRMLRQLVHERWFDVLNLTLSGALRREQQVQAMGTTIRAAQAASLNPELVVIVDGRVFFERPQTYLDVGADAGCVTVIEAVPVAQRLLDALPSRRSHPPAAINPATIASLRLFEQRFKSTVF